MSEPKYLYRYRPFNDFSKDILINNRLWFSSPKDFNDPFDCKVVFDKNNISDDEWRLYFQELVRTKNPKISYFDMMSWVNNGLKIVHNDEQKREKYLKIIHNGLVEAYQTLKILCLSEVNNNILMWSHYSDKHTGFCLEFDFQLLREWKYNEKYLILFSAEYVNQYPSFSEAYKIMREVVNRSNTASASFFARLKSKNHWEYEAEWRCIKFPHTQKEYTDFDGINILYPPEMLTGVIFGCEMKDDVRKELMDIVKSNPKLGHVRFHEAKKKPNEFGLDIVAL